MMTLLLPVMKCCEQLHMCAGTAWKLKLQGEVLTCKTLPAYLASDA